MTGPITGSSSRFATIETGINRPCEAREIPAPPRNAAKQPVRAKKSSRHRRERRSARNRSPEGISRAMPLSSSDSSRNRCESSSRTAVMRNEY